MARITTSARASNYHVAKSKSDVYFLQQKVIIRATNNLNLHRKIVANKLREKVARITGPLILFSAHFDPLKFL